MEMASRIQSVIDERALQQLGTLEQDLVYGDAGPPEVMSFLVEKGAYCTPADKVKITALPSMPRLGFCEEEGRFRPDQLAISIHAMGG